MKESAFSKLWPFVRPYWLLILVSTVFSIFASLFSGSIAWLVKPILDKIFLEKNYFYLKLLPLGIVCLYFLRGSSVFLQAYFMRMAALKLVNDLRARMFERILYLPLSGITRETSGKLISRVINDTEILENLLSNVFRTILIEGLTVFVLVGVALWRRWDLTLLALTVFPLVAFCSKRLAQKSQKTRRLAQEEMANITSRLSEAIIGLKDIKIFCQEQKINSKFSYELKSFYRLLLKLTKYNEGTKFSVNLLAGLGGAVVFSYGGYLIVHKIITAGDFFSVLTAILMIFNPVKKLSNAYTKSYEAIAAVNRLEDILSLAKEKSGKKKALPPKKGIFFNKVSFKYPGSKDIILSEIDFYIPVGKIVALVGPSGAGKTSLISLIPRFYDPISGNISFDNTDIREFDLNSLRSLIGIVSQEVILFNDTVAENIAFGKPGATQEEIEQAAKLAYAHDFIINLPQGYNTLLGEKGLNLSGGQRQRIAIARAILKNPPILILDEATSQLDSVSESLVHQALQRLMKGKTTIIIAHRLSTIENADLLIVMDKGKIISKGTHKEILEKCTLYQELYFSFSNSHNESFH